MRPSLNGTRRQGKITVTMPDAVKEIAELIGGGSMAKGIRIALIRYALEHQGSLELDPDQVLALKNIAKKDKHQNESV